MFPQKGKERALTDACYKDTSDSSCIRFLQHARELVHSPIFWPLIEETMEKIVQLNLKTFEMNMLLNYSVLASSYNQINNHHGERGTL
jgi:hypothetical protein